MSSTTLPLHSLPLQRLLLPKGFRPQDFLTFHGRDQLAVSEKVTGSTLEKAIVWKDRPALLTLVFDLNAVKYQLALDDPLLDVSAEETLHLVQHILGLTQAIAGFEQAYADHPLLGRMLAEQSGLRVPVSVSPFEALTWAIIGQQVSLSAAIAMRRKFIQQANIRHSSGFYCYPSPAQVAQLSVASLRLAGLSQSKANTLLKVSELMLTGALPLDDWLHNQASPELIATSLATIKGIGPWTISYALLRGYGWLDGSLHGDAAVRRAIRGLMALAQLSDKEAEQWLKPFSPWRALLAAHLWAWQSRTPG
ncbi:MAG TPA: 3-methyladenine DNA glycosylase 2 [Methylophilus sp.]|uniref:DNA-3-methyladenine glycosylase family protein n=1 Tax=Methylophilus sp. TaxID=29541 RepID=UPI002BA3B52E|nr:3-methyladenine DNA glycosylase 2 [Methylophilus sp.]HSH86983.1 3-methyladenine DNA glycosylase 2 [Methylophilus sp.]